MPDPISGTVEVIVVLGDEGHDDDQALVDLVSKWVDAVEIGFFGPGRMRPLDPIATGGGRMTGRLECERVAHAAFHVLWRMTRYFSKVKRKVETFNVFHEGHSLSTAEGAESRALPDSIPFVVEYPEDLKRYLRMEIEFRAPISPSDRDALFHALSIWDALVEALADDEWWGRRDHAHGDRPPDGRRG